MSVVLAMGRHRFSGETDDYPPDSVIRHTKKEKKSHSNSRSVEPPLVTAAEPYPRGSLLAPILNPVHKALYDTTVAVTRAPGDLLYGIKPGEKVDLEESDSEDYSDSDSDSDDPRDSRRRGGGASGGPLHTLLGGGRGDRRFRREERRDERRERFEDRRDERRARIEERKRERERYVQGLFGNPNAGKEKPTKNKKHRKEESVEEIAPGRFRLVLCYWDGQREVF